MNIFYKFIINQKSLSFVHEFISRFMNSLYLRRFKFKFVSNCKNIKDFYQKLLFVMKRVYKLT